MIIKMGKCTRCQKKNMVRLIFTKKYGYSWLCSECLNYLEYEDGGKNDTIIFSSQSKRKKKD
jgi:hypothetical protein